MHMNIDIHLCIVVWKTGMESFNSFGLLFTFETKTVTTEKMTPKE